MTSPPTIEWRASLTPFAVITSQAFSGSGFSGAVPAGTTSGALTVRIYNNFLAVASIADATNCVLAVYDDVVHQGTAVTTPAVALYVQAKVLDYNGVTTGADSAYVGLGGSTKHAVPVNGGVLAGSGSATNYVTVSLQIVVPSTATQGSISQGIWLEYNSSA